LAIAPREAGLRLSCPYPCVNDDRKFAISLVPMQVQKPFKYLFDFGESHQFQIVLVAVRKPVPDMVLPKISDQPPSSWWTTDFDLFDKQKETDLKWMNYILGAAPKSIAIYFPQFLADPSYGTTYLDRLNLHACGLTVK